MDCPIKHITPGLDIQLSKAAKPLPYMAISSNRRKKGTGMQGMEGIKRKLGLLPSNKMLYMMLMLKGTWKCLVMP